MLDLSDGLSSDLGHICDRSEVGVRVWADRLPVSEAVREVAKGAGLPVLDLCLAGGEDYELCFTAPPGAAETLAAALTEETDCQVTVIGEILPKSGGRHLILADGEEIALAPEGWQHFRAEP